MVSPSTSKGRIMRTSIFLVSALAVLVPVAALGQPPALRQVAPRATTGPPPAPDATAALEATIPSGARKLGCEIHMSWGGDTSVRVVNPGPQKVDAGAAVMIRVRPGGETSQVIQDDLGTSDSLSVELPAKFTSVCVAYVVPPGVGGAGGTRLASLAAIQGGPRYDLKCSVFSLPTATGGPFSQVAYATGVMLQNSGSRTLRKGTRVAYAIGTSIEVWHTLLKDDVAPGGGWQAPSHMKASMTPPFSATDSPHCGAWVGE
jgi:hypothetical protein